MNSQTKKIVSIIFKVAIISLAFLFIYHKLNNNHDLFKFSQLTTSLTRHKVYSVLTVVLSLMFLNWFLEALKWRFLVERIERINIWQALESVFCGLTWAVFTPNRIGEYGGRMFFLSPRKRILGAIAMAVGAIGQMVITNVMGATALLWFTWRFISPELWIYCVLVFLWMVFCGFFILIYFNISWLNYILNHFEILKPLRRFFFILARYRFKQLWKVFLYSITRFVVFTSQYYLIINLLLPELLIFEICMMIFILFFIQSAIPSLDLLDVGVRSSVATYFFGFITGQDVAIMAATASVWFINLIIPAILGAGFVLKINFFGTNNR
ncbi:MAG TPA: lysylphosphatidylglycerol synthase domain-containing protein [Sphingobacteriaceae bacterium]|nr:lysylphosphatidylglycerol synthase domain-containing protein [Sphingobacteriaceae bacterium]